MKIQKSQIRYASSIEKAEKPQEMKLEDINSMELLDDKDKFGARNALRREISIKYELLVSWQSSANLNATMLKRTKSAQMLTDI